MKVKISIFILFVLLGLSSLLPFQASAQKSKSSGKLSPFTLQMRKLDSLANLKDPQQRKQQVDKFWAELVKKQQVPFVDGDSVAFLYKGKVDSVSWQGDFNGWGSRAGGYIFNNRGYRVGKSDVWRMKAAFPKDARVDYKIVLNGREWVTDPANPKQQWGGSGPSSELRMPEWKPESATLVKEENSIGILSDNLQVNSGVLGYKINYKVYTPANYDQLANLPVIYVTDGHEYADEKLGAMTHVLDNLIAEKKIKPVIAVFLDPREVEDAGNNRRMIELPLNDQFLEFVTKELIPSIDKNYKTNPSPDARGIMGTSLGGLNAAYTGIKASNMVRLIGIHSPAFWYRPQIYTLFEESPVAPLKIFMSTGVISDTEEGARRMKSILERKNYNLLYKEINEGHSWGNWRSLIDDVLIYFFAE